MRTIEELFVFCPECGGLVGYTPTTEWSFLEYEEYKYYSPRTCECNQHVHANVTNTFDADEFQHEVTDFCEVARIGFSCGGGTIRVMAKEAYNFFGGMVPFDVLCDLIYEVAQKAEGFYAGAFFEEDRGNAEGFGKRLQRCWKVRVGGIGVMAFNIKRVLV